MTGLPLILVSTTSALAGIFFGVKVATQTDDAGRVQTAHSEPVQLQYAAPEIFVYPLQAGNALSGYLVVRFVLPLVDGGQEKIEPSDDTNLADAFYASVFSMRATNSATDVIPQLEVLKSAFIKAANRNAGYFRYKDALFQQFDYFEPNVMRRKNVRERKVEAESDDIKPKSTH